MLQLLVSDINYGGETVLRPTRAADCNILSLFSGVQVPGSGGEEVQVWCEARQGEVAVDDEGPGPVQSVLRWRPADPGGGVCPGWPGGGGHQVSRGPALRQNCTLRQTALSSRLAAGGLGALQCHLWAGPGDQRTRGLQAATLSVRLHPRLSLAVPGLRPPGRPDGEVVRGGRV